MLYTIKQRLYYIKNFKKGFSLVYLLPGSIREKISKNLFFKTIIKHVPELSFTERSDGSIEIESQNLTLDYPNGCFFEGDFFDIVYPNLGIKNKLVDMLIYDNPYYDAEGVYENFGAKIRTGDVVIDAGANIGTFSVIASNKVGNSGKIFAFEPMPEIIQAFRHNLEINNCRNVEIVNNILGDINSTVDFFYNLDKNYNASSKTIKKDGDNVLKVEQITLDNFVKANNIQKVNFIKADIEGAERDLLRGARETIIKYRPCIAIRTYHLQDDPEVLYQLVKSFVPEYNIKLFKKTLYAWI